MSQQINLYRPIFRKQEKKFSALAMLQAGVAVFVGVAVIYGLMLWQVGDLREEVRQAEKQVAASVKRLDDAARTFGPGAKSKSLEDEVKRLERQLAARLHLRDVLNRGIFGNNTGYSDFFVALARQHVPGIWLTAFDIEGAGEAMRLQGRTTEAANVPRYVQRLAAEEVLSGQEFQVFVLSRPQDKNGRANSPYVEFLLRTGPAKESR